MEGFVLILVCLAIKVQFYGVFSDNGFIRKELNTFHRDKRNHEYDLLNSTINTKPGTTDIEVFKKHDTNKRREQISLKTKPKVVRNPKKDNIKIVDDKHTGKITVPLNRKHFIEDIDEESPVHCTKVIKPRLSEGAVKATSENTPLKNTEIPKKGKIESIPKKLFPENVTKESSQELIPVLRTADPKNDKNATVSSVSKGVSTEKNINSTKDKAKDKPVINFRNAPIAQLDSKKQGADNSIIEIKEHKYEEEIVRFHPTKSCQPNIKRHWESSQNFNPLFSNPYAQAMNSYQGSQTDPYQRVNTYNKVKYLPAYTCTHYMDKSNGNYFYANFDTEAYKLAKEKPNQFANCDRIRKVWLDRNTKIRTANPNEYTETNMKKYVISND